MINKHIGILGLLVCKNELFYKGNQYFLKRGVHMHLWHPPATASIRIFKLEIYKPELFEANGEGHAGVRSTMTN